MLSAIYLRLSRDEENRGVEEVLYSHRNALVKLAEKNNLHYELYEEVSSGMDTERPQLNKLLENLPDYDYVLVMDIDRLTRDNIHAEQIKRIFILNDIKILTPSGEIDFNNESNDLLFSFSSLLANYEWKQIRKRMGRGRLAAAAQGKWVMSNKVPLGYNKNEEKKLVIREDEARIIKFIFEKTIKGYSSNRIARELDALKWRSRQGKVLTTSHISILRKNDVYYGCVSMKRRVNGKVVDEVFVENAHEGIVTKQEFFEAQRVVGEKNREFRQKGIATRKLHGLIYCNCCGRKRYIQKDGNGTEFLKTCSYKIDNNKCEDRGHKYLPIEEAVIKAVQNLRPQLEQSLERLKTRDTSTIEKTLMEQKTDLQNSLNRVNKRSKNLAIMRSDGEITKQEFEELRNEVNEQIQNIEQQIELINMQLENVLNTDQEQERLERILFTLNDFSDLENAEVNAFLKMIIKKINFSSNMSSSHDTKVDRVEPTISIEFHRKF
ncbi:recombinase family protein [Peribacillus simplex]|uniref:recombinase family protein n=1 Tax=Peribacillus simplex TaxID=1478 RepID=UPI00203D0C46|nr:recombinase family protein [Peribacillus simplex]MCM3673189.1 recombinase family protein [Peribacillus simplex]